MKTVIPRAAHAKLSCRLVPHMDPHDTAHKVKAYIESLAAGLLANVTVKVSGFRSDPWTSPRDTPGQQLRGGGGKGGGGKAMMVGSLFKAQFSRNRQNALIEGKPCALRCDSSVQSSCCSCQLQPLWRGACLYLLFQK